MDLEIHTYQADDRTVVVATGDIDLVSFRKLRDVIDGLIVDRLLDLVIDLDGVTFLDSMGLGVLVGTRRKTYAFGGSLEIACSNPSLLQLLRLTHLDRVFTIRDAAPQVPTASV